MKITNIKTIIISIFVLVIMLISSCGEDKELQIYCDDIDIFVTEEVDLNAKITNNLSQDFEYIYSYIGDNFEINDSTLKGVKAGVDYLYIEVENYPTILEVKVTVNEGSISLSGPNSVKIYDQITLNLERTGVSDSAMVLWNSSDKSVARVSTKGVVTGIYFGTCTITATIGSYTAWMDVEVLHLPTESFEIENDLVLEKGNEYTLNYTILPEEALNKLVIEQNDENLVEITKDNKIKTLNNGKCVLSVYPEGFENLKKQISLEVLSNEAPKITKEADFLDTVDVNYNKISDLLQGLSVEDNADGDLSDKIECDMELLKSYGEKDVTFTVKDRAGNVSSFTRHINVVYNYHTKFVGHAGCWNAVPNSEEAFLIAARDLKYQALECDLQVTSDGVYVLNHDSFIGDFVISKHTYKELMEVEITDSSKHKAHACTLDRYFEICKEYNCEAIVEIKGSSPGLVDTNTSKVEEFIEYIKSHGMYERTIILCSMQGVIRKIRELGYDIRIQYLVQSADNYPTLNFCIETNSDLSTNVTYGGSNTMKYLQMYWDAGLEISVWTFSGSYSQIQEWIDKGVEYVTTDCHKMDELNLK